MPKADRSEAGGGTEWQPIAILIGTEQLLAHMAVSAFCRRLTAGRMTERQSRTDGDKQLFGAS